MSWAEPALRSQCWSKDFTWKFWLCSRCPIPGVFSYWTSHIPANFCSVCFVNPILLTGVRWSLKVVSVSSNLSHTCYLDYECKKSTILFFLKSVYLTFMLSFSKHTTVWAHGSNAKAKQRPCWCPLHSPLVRFLCNGNQFGPVVLFFKRKVCGNMSLRDHLWWVCWE